jgi:hypothetical protein
MKVFYFDDWRGHLSTQHPSSLVSELPFYLTSRRGWVIVAKLPDAFENLTTKVAWLIDKNPKPYCLAGSCRMLKAISDLAI